MPKSRNRAADMELVALLLDPVRLPMPEVARRLGSTLSAAYARTSELRRLGHYFPDRRTGRKSPRRRKPAPKSPPRPRKPSGVVLSTATLDRRIAAWTRWQARRRRLGLPAAGVPVEGLARILTRNERRAAP